ncbi:hypothetical protein [uncultured Psychrobacter sp.]|uniref:hypothetical protein n=1 Tax=uncultured Psychrobacter sp. TaxID=259303 RepID=UPI002594D442|nr:hypothetical protein [uncultured Psychrobacter sp.]
MSERNNILESIGSHINDYPEVAERWRAGDPTVRAMLTSIVEAAVFLKRDNDVNAIEPFIKSKNRTIIADAINKGILPVATPCQHKITIENAAAKTLTLSQGRLLEDGTGRQWRLLAAITVGAGATKTVLAEQSTVNYGRVTIPVNEPFYTMSLSTTDDAYFSSIGITNVTSGEVYQHTPKFMNAGINQPIYTLQSDNLSNINVIFGASDRAGKTVQAGEVYEVAITQTYGEVDPASLKQASLSEIADSDESALNIYFKAGDMTRAGANPLTINQLRLLASFPSMYDRNAVFMGNFTFLIMQHFMSRLNYMAIWNETAHERYYGASLDSINHLNLAIVPKLNTELERAQLITDIQQLVARADSLLDGRVRVMSAIERPYKITITGRLAAVHDIDSVRVQIKELLLVDYGKGSLAANHHNADGFNLQELSTRLRGGISAFQDRISDFTVSGEDVGQNPVKPHEWAFLSDNSITINLTRTADSGNAIWTM